MKWINLFVGKKQDMMQIHLQLPSLVLQHVDQDSLLLLSGFVHDLVSIPYSNNTLLLCDKDHSQ